MIVEGCKSGDYNMDFGKTGGMSTATVAAKGTEGACNKQDGREHEEGREKGT